MAIESPHLVGVTLAVIAAGGISVGLLCARLGMVHGSIVDGVFISLLTNALLVIVLVAVLGGMPSLPPTAILWFALAGLSGLLLAQLCIFRSVEIIGASRTSPVVSASVFFATLFGVVLFGESLTILHAIGIGGIVVGVSVISWDTARSEDPSVSVRDAGISLLLPLLAALFAGADPIFIALGLRETAEILPGVAVQATAAAIGFSIYLLAVGQLGRHTFAWSQEKRWFVATGVANTVAMMAYFAALQAAPVVIVVPLVTTSPLIVVLLSLLFLPRRLEHITRRVVGAAIVVVIGASIVGVQ